MDSLRMYSLTNFTKGIAIYSIIFSLFSIVQGTILLSQLPKMTKHTDFDYYENVYSQYGYTLVMVAIILIIVSVFVFVGVNTKQRGFLLPWLIVNCLMFILGMPWLLYVITQPDVPRWMSASTFVGLAMMIYFYKVIISYYKSVKLNISREPSFDEIRYHSRYTRFY